MFDIHTTTSNYMSLVVTNRCNLQCPFCIHGKNDDQILSKPHFLAALAFAKERGIGDILFVGGEPTLHPDILWMTKTCKEQGFTVILTTNCQDLPLLYELDDSVDSFNCSDYGQLLPDMSHFHHADVTISALIHKQHLNTKEALDYYIGRKRYQYPSATLKFSTLSVCNDFTYENQSVPYLDTLPGTRVVLFNELIGQVYRDVLIKRYDQIINQAAVQSYKCHVDGTICRHW